MDQCVACPALHTTSTTKNSEDNSSCIAKQCRFLGRAVGESGSLGGAGWSPGRPFKSRDPC
eukprot:366236-Chlamydomonas_euryale.AAC.3